MRRNKPAILIVDHGSRSAESNLLLHEIVERFAQRFAEEYSIIEPAHMEIAEPSISTAYASAVRGGATDVIVCPFFLGPGKHWQEDIPRLVREAAAKFPHTNFRLAAPLGVNDLMLDLIHLRIEECMESKVGDHV